MTIRPALVACEGAGSAGNNWGFANDVATTLAGNPWDDILAQFRGASWARKFNHYEIQYPAAAFPMGPSVKIGIDQVINTILSLPAGTPTFGISYSEGQLVWGTVYRKHMLPQAGVLHSRLKDFQGLISFGDPMRCPGQALGNEFAGFPVPAPVFGYVSGGISGPGNIRDSEMSENILSCSNDGDMYACAPVGAVPWLTETAPGHDETLIYNLVQDFNAHNILAIATAVIPLLNPAADVAALIAELPSLLIGLVGGGLGGSSLMTALPAGAGNAQIVGFIEALLNSGMFFLTGLTPHGDYGKMVPAMCQWILQKVEG